MAREGEPYKLTVFTDSPEETVRLLERQLPVDHLGKREVRLIPGAPGLQSHFVMPRDEV